MRAHGSVLLYVHRTVRLFRTRAQDGHLDFHTALNSDNTSSSSLLLLNVHGGEMAYEGPGTEWEGDDRVKARPRKLPEKDRRDRGPPPEQWKC